jgi:hypothetical protein
MHKIVVTRVTAERWKAEYNQEVIVEGSRTPALDACRVLLGRGLVGTLEMWHANGCYPALRVDIEKGAGLTVEDGDRGVAFRRYREFSVKPDEVASV